MQAASRERSAKKHKNHKTLILWDTISDISIYLYLCVCVWTFTHSLANETVTKRWWKWQNIWWQQRKVDIHGYTCMYISVYMYICMYEYIYISHIFGCNSTRRSPKVPLCERSSFSNAFDGALILWPACE